MSDVTLEVDFDMIAKIVNALKSGEIIKFPEYFENFFSCEKALDSDYTMIGSLVNDYEEAKRSFDPNLNYFKGMIYSFLNKKSLTSLFQKEIVENIY